MSVLGLFHPPLPSEHGCSLAGQESSARPLPGSCCPGLGCSPCQEVVTGRSQAAAALGAGGALFPRGFGTGEEPQYLQKQDFYSLSVRIEQMKE